MPIRHPIKLELSTDITLHAIPAFVHNWIWIIQSAKAAWVVDPGDHQPVLTWLDQHPKSPLSGILVTHRHPDHINGISTLLARYPQIHIWAPRYHSWHFPHHPVSDKDSFRLNTDEAEHPIIVEALHTPGHLPEHVCYCLPEQGILFSGDTLFSLGCGRIFEGTPELFWNSLLQLRALPDHYYLACAHEYGRSNTEFALALTPNTQELKAFYRYCLEQEAQGYSTLPTRLFHEKQLNPFLRCDDPVIKNAAEHHAGIKLDTPEHVFAVIRAWKNVF